VQSSQLKNPGTVISFSVVSGRLLEEYATPRTGLQTGDNDKFSLAFWEVYPLGNPWALFQRTAEITKHYAGARQILRWHPDGKEIKSNPSSAIRGIDCCGSKGIWFTEWERCLQLYIWVKYLIRMVPHLFLKAKTISFLFGAITRQLYSMRM
jgi:hypothetical protein